MGAAKYRIIGITVMFVGLIFFPKINTYLKLISDTKNFENRTMADKPVFDLKTISTYPQRYENFFNDRFCIRSRMINAFNYYNVICLKKSPIPDKLIIGNNNWLYRAGDEINAYAGRESLTAGELDTLKRELEYRTDFYSKKNIKFYFFIAPEKAVIHPENLPYNYQKKSGVNWGRQLIDYLSKNSTIKTINAYDYLLLKKSEGNLYYRNDNHWNNLGAFFSSRVICNEINKDFGDIKPIPENEVKYRDSIKPDGNLSAMISNIGDFKSDVDRLVIPKAGFKSNSVPNKGYKSPEGFLYSWAYEIRKEQPQAKHKILIISDSFGETLFPYMAESFNSTVKIWDAWNYRINAEIVEQEQPEIVLLVVHEALLRNIKQNLSFTGAKSQKH